MSDLEKLWQEQMQDSEFKTYADEMQAARDISMEIARCRAEKNLSQKELSVITGVSQADISRLESCEGNPSLKTLNRIAKGLGKQLRIEFV